MIPASSLQTVPLVALQIWSRCQYKNILADGLKWLHFYLINTTIYEKTRFCSMKLFSITPQMWDCYISPVWYRCPSLSSSTTVTGGHGRTVLIIVPPVKFFLLSNIFHCHNWIPRFGSHVPMTWVLVRPPAKILVTLWHYGPKWESPFITFYSICFMQNHCAI